jgi:hypothetical protein
VKKVIIIGVAVVVGLCILVAALGFGGGMLLTQGAADVGNNFMTAITNNDYNKAWDTCHPALQKEIGSVQKLQQMIEGGNAKPVSYSFTSRNVENNAGKLEGTATLTGNRQANVVVSLAKNGNDWQVIGFNIKEK